MRIALFGYGKMGKEIEQIALQRGHEISLKITSENTDQREEARDKADVIIEFSKPEVAIDNINIALETGIPVVVGTTGWLDALEDVSNKVADMNGALLWASNFSIGVNIFFEINSKLAELMNPHADYSCEVEETHHIHKLDAPSGTAISIAHGIIQQLDRKTSWALDTSDNPKDLVIKAHRVDEVPGTHLVNYESDIDKLTIRHEAKNRKGFAMGSVIAAEWLMGKKGVYTMKDVLSI